MDQFPHEPVYSMEDLSFVRLILEKIYRKLFNQYLPYWYQVCKKEKVNLLHSHFGYTGVQDRPLAIKLGIPHVVSFYGVDLGKSLYYKPSLKSSYKIMFHEVASVFVEGAYAKNTIIKFGCPVEKVHISHLGVDLNSIKPVKRIWRPQEPFNILIVGTFTQKKGIIIALKAIEKVLREKPRWLLRISLVGDARKKKDEQRIKREIMEFVDSTTLKKIITFYGYLPYKQVLEMSHEHHLLMQTSIKADDGDCEGGFPVIITDMMATGMPVLGSTHCDIPEIIKHGKNGKLAAEGNVEDTAEKLKDLICNFKEYAPQWLKFNAKFINDNFNAVNCNVHREMLYTKFASSF